MPSLSTLSWSVFYGQKLRGKTRCHTHVNSMIFNIGCSYDDAILSRIGSVAIRIASRGVTSSLNASREKYLHKTYHRAFFSSGDTVSESNYAPAANVWQRSIRMLSEYSEQYLKIDVLLLVDIFENFCKSCVASYSLDPARYYALSGFTWDAILKHTCLKFELLTDNMVLTISYSSSDICGGLNQCSDRYAKVVRSTCVLTCRNYCRLYVDVSTIAIRRISMAWKCCELWCKRSLRIRPPVIFSRLISSICSICTTDTLTFLFVRCTISCLASARINFLRCMINSVTFITTIVPVMSQLVTIFGCYNSLNPPDFMITLNSVHS